VRSHAYSAQGCARFADQDGKGGDGRDGAGAVDEGMCGDFGIVAGGADECEGLCGER
jgi:hypothetical protein